MLLNKLILVSSIALSLNAWAAEPTDDMDFDAIPPLSSGASQGKAGAGVVVKPAASGKTPPVPQIDNGSTVDIHSAAPSGARPVHEPVITRNSSTSTGQQVQIIPVTPVASGVQTIPPQAVLKNQSNTSVVNMYGAANSLPPVSPVNQFELMNHNSTLQSQGREIAVLTNQVQIQSLQLDLAKKRADTFAAMGESPSTQKTAMTESPKVEKPTKKEAESKDAMSPLMFTLTGTLKVKGKMVAFISNSQSDWTVGKGDMLPGGYRVVSISLDSMQIKNSEGVVRKVFPG